MLKISVLVSGGGTNFQSVIDAVESGYIPEAKIVQVISSSPKAYALERGQKHGIPGYVVSTKAYPDPKEKSERILSLLKDKETDLIVLAGYMSVVDESIIREYRGKIVNIHPSLIPKFCGKGFYGKRVHEAVLAAGEKVSGATVHYVDEGIDTGEIILQEQVPVLESDTPDTLAARVLEVEHKILTRAIRDIAMKHSCSSLQS